MTPEQALANLYNASKVSLLTAIEHEVIKQSYSILLNYLSVPREKPTEATVSEPTI